MLYVIWLTIEPVYDYVIGKIYSFPSEMSHAVFQGSIL